VSIIAAGILAPSDAHAIRWRAGGNSDPQNAKVHRDRPWAAAQPRCRIGLPATGRPAPGSGAVDATLAGHGVISKRSGWAKRQLEVASGLSDAMTWEATRCWMWSEGWTRAASLEEMEGRLLALLTPKSARCDS
jgi:hypothetical protein